MPNKAQLPNGTWVYRLEKMWIPEWGGFVPVAGYDNHFVYEVSDIHDKGSTLRCTCGSAAIVVGVSGYVGDASPQGKLIVCLLHSTSGSHSNEGSKWI
jgi:hypothetical protein